MNTNIKVRPIFFSAEMIRALLAGSKKMTRRVVKLPSQVLAPSTNPVEINMCENVSGCWSAWDAANNRAKKWEMVECPYGTPGERLWVKEHLRADDRGMYYPADDSLVQNIPEDFNAPVLEYLNGMFMPKWASRITLEITGVRVERLQTASLNDILAEGVERERPDWSDELVHSKFRQLWEKFNGNKHPWDDNPWVWVIEFVKVSDAV